MLIIMPTAIIHIRGHCSQLPTEEKPENEKDLNRKKQPEIFPPTLQRRLAILDCSLVDETAGTAGKTGVPAADKWPLEDGRWCEMDRDRVRRSPYEILSPCPAAVIAPPILGA